MARRSGAEAVILDDVGTFRPLPKDDADLAWFFARGEKATSRYTTPEVRKRARRIERRLNGRGYYLQLYYVRGEIPDLRLLLRDYRAYVQYAGEEEPFLVVPRARLEQLALLGWREYEIVSTFDWDSNRRNFSQDQRRAHAPVTDILDGIETSTWGHARLDASAAKWLLEWSCGLTIHETVGLSDEQALQKLKAELARLPEGAPAQPPLTETGAQREHKQAIREAVRDADGVRGLEALLALARRERRLMREEGDLEPLPGRTTFTVSELARLLMLDNGWVRRALIHHGLRDARIKRRPLPVVWLDSDRGRDFRERAANEFRARNLQRMRLQNPRFSVTRGYR